MYPRYFGPLIVIRRTKGGAYILAEMDGSILRGKYGAFRVLPHVARYAPIELPENIEKLIGMTRDELDKLAESDDEKEVATKQNPDYIFEDMPVFRPENDETFADDSDRFFDELENSTQTESRQDKVKRVRFAGV